MYFGFIILAITCVYPTTGKIFTRCEFATELANNGIKEDIAGWVCMAENNSHRRIDTRRMFRTSNLAHNFELGVFKISSLIWCEDFRNVINECGVMCRNLVDDDIEDDVKCALQIFAQYGKEGWHSWEDKCKWSNVTDYVKDCSP